MKKFPWLHIILFLLTFLSTLIVGALHEGVDLLAQPSGIVKGMTFSLTLLVILLSHEFSHYYFSRMHHVDATLPYFIPAPTLFGTLGAFIKMRSPITTRNALMDIGASGPIAGFIISVIATCIGLSLSSITPLVKGSGMITLGDSLLFTGLSKLILGTLPENQDVLLHPMAFAGWIGFFVTSLNLLPIGQLDGGHISYALLGDRHHLLSKVFVPVLAILGIVLFEGWLIWAVLLLILGIKHPPVIASDIPLDSRRKALGIAALIIFILTFIPVPITVI
ncbi:MAG: site-2 protease family protein [Nitrospirae bacterium]|nr:MAG: site-2 protease family protein [Nitrospirota bacterium]